MKVRELRPGMVYAPPVPEMMSMIFIARAQHPLWPGLNLVVWRDVDRDDLILDALDPNMVLEGKIYEADGETRLAWLRRGVLGRVGAEDMIAAVNQVLKSNPRPPVTQGLLDSYRDQPTYVPPGNRLRGPVLSSLAGTVPPRDVAGIARDQVNHPEKGEEE